MSEFVEIVDVGPRDGIQSQPTLLDTDTKVEFITRLVDAGVRRLEIASFVNPKRVPQMADSEEVISRVPKRDGVSYIGLVMNQRGFDRAAESGIDQINCVVVATDTFATKNQGRTSRETLEAVEPIARAAREAGIFCGVTIGASFGCPFEGEVQPAYVTDLVKALNDYGVDEIALADTIGAAGPSNVKQLLELAGPAAGDTRLRCHFHDTRNTGVANAFAALEMGVRILDASCGGLGGCPFAPAATGNVATEDLLYMIHRMGLTTGIDIDKIIATAHWLEEPLGASMPAMVARAGVFPNNISH